MSRLVNDPSPARAPGSQQQAVIDAVARRQYGRWAVQYRAANVWAAVDRDAALRTRADQPAGAVATTADTPAGPGLVDRLKTIAALRESGVLSDDEFARLKAAVLSAS